MCCLKINNKKWLFLFIYHLICISSQMFPSLSKVILDFLNLTDNLDCGNHYEYLYFNEMILQAFLLLRLFSLS